MRFWDSSALAPLLLQEQATRAVRALYDDDSELTVWWGTEVECASAISRYQRMGVLSGGGAASSLERFDALKAGWREVLPHDQVRAIARRLVRVHELRAGDAFQLAAAVTASEGYPSSLSFVTMDRRLLDAARTEGFPVLDPSRR